MPSHAAHLVVRNLPWKEADCLRAWVAPYSTVVTCTPAQQEDPDAHYDVCIVPGRDRARLLGILEFFGHAATLEHPG